jgi:polyadenylate-binding protein
MDNFNKGNENAHKMIFVSDLPKSTSYLDMAEYYEEHVGPCQINIKRSLFKNYYYAFVMFETIEAAKKATEELRFPRINGTKMCRALPYNMHAVRGEPGGKDVQSTSIFVKGFEQTKWTHEDLYAKFCTYGKILSCKVSIDLQHNFLGFGYIQFSKIEEAQMAIEKVSRLEIKTHF